MTKRARSTRGMRGGPPLWTLKSFSVPFRQKTKPGGRPIRWRRERGRSWLALPWGFQTPRLPGT